MSQLTGNIFEELKERISGDVYADKLRRYMHSTDGSIFRVEPACVVYPKNTDDVVAAVKFAQDYGLSVHSRGAGSGLCGSAIGKGIVIDFAKYMNRLVDLDTEGKTFTCQPGYRFGELNAALKGVKLFFPPDPSSGEYATFGGMYGTNASGAHSVKYGNVADYILDAEVVFSDGVVRTFSDIADTPVDQLPPMFRKLFDMYTENTSVIEDGYPAVKYNVTGYNLRSMVKDGKLNLGTVFGGSEGTFGVVTRLTFKLLEKPTYDSLVVAYFDDIVSSAKAVQKILPMAPAGIEIMDKSLLGIARESDKMLAEKLPADIDNVCMIEFDGFDEEEVSKLAAEAMRILEEEKLARESFLAVSAEEKAKFWAVRVAAVPILYRLKDKKKILALVEDAVVPTDKLVEYFEGMYDIFGRHSIRFVIYGHIAKGLLHTRPLLDLKDPHDIEMLKVLADEVFTLVNGLGGCVSGEHGDGRIRSCYIPKTYSKELVALFKEAKNALDFKGIFNPDIKTVFDDFQMTKYLRYGSDYRSHELPKKALVWDGHFMEEVEKCHGCSKCTTTTVATRMCPIYKGTRDEAAAPKAKANVLRALISGAIDDSSLYEEAFQYVIDHCVNCGSCSMECPSRVNIPKLAMEARSKYVEKFGAPLPHKLVTSVELAARTTRKVSPALAVLMKPKFMRKVQEMTIGLTAEREFIPFASKSLYERIDRVEGEGKTVLYFAGCYASYIKPEVGEATVKVLKGMGYKVVTPEQHCCGVPHVTKGMAKEARKKIEQNLKSWYHLLKDADHIVVSCSSCGLSLMKEWGYLMHDDRIDEVKKKIIHVSRLVNANFDKLDLKETNESVAYHAPCHLKIQEDPGSSVAMLKKLPGVKVEDLASNCCGMAGSWGLMADHYDLSVKIGKPMIDKLNDSVCALGATDCPTCTMQMEHLSKKTIIHPVELVARCLKD